MRNELANPRSDAIAGTRSAIWRERFRAWCDGQDLILHGLGLAGDLLLELRVAHHLGIVLEFG